MSGKRKGNKSLTVCTSSLGASIAFTGSFGSQSSYVLLSIALLFLSMIASSCTSDLLGAIEDVAVGFGLVVIPMLVSWRW